MAKKEKEKLTEEDVLRLKMAGEWLVKQRDLLSQEEVAARATELGAAMSQDAVSKLERGLIQKPAMRDLVALGKLYGSTPNDMAQLYGYWSPGERENVFQEDWLLYLHTLYRQLKSRYRPRFRKNVGELTELWERRLLES